MDKLSIGIDFGGTSIKMGVVQGKEIIHESERIDPQGHASASELIGILAETVLNLKKLYPEIRSVGVGVPGFVDFPTGTIHNLTNVAGWSHIPLKFEMFNRTGLPCAVENDANCMAIAEWKLGAGVGHEHLVCITLGTGVGGGVIVNNQMVRGAHYAAGELGQASIDYNGTLGNYNNKGALEKYIGNNQIAEFVHEQYAAAGIDKPLSQCFPVDLSTYAKDGCEVALACWDEIARKLAASVGSACWLLNPDAVVIGGGVANADELLFEPFKKHLFAQLNGPFKDQLQILKAHFSNEAGILGAAELSADLVM